MLGPGPGTEYAATALYLIPLTRDLSRAGDSLRFTDEVGEREWPVGK